MNEYENRLGKLAYDVFHAAYTEAEQEEHGQDVNPINALPWEEAPHEVRAAFVATVKAIKADREWESMGR